MSFLDTEEFEDRFIRRPCYVCGVVDVIVGEKDAGYNLSPADFLHLLHAKACKTCQSHGAPLHRPDDWTGAKSAAIRAEIRAAAHPPQLVCVAATHSQHKEAVLDIYSRMF